MNRSIPAWQTGGFLFTCIAGTLLHFLFDWSGGTIGAALFSAVNESIWEHLKLIYVPMLVFAWAEDVAFQKTIPSFWCIKLVGLLTAMVLIPVIYYSYTGIGGINADWFNITIFFLVAGIVFYLETRLFQSGWTCKLPPWAAKALIVLIGGLFILLTFLPPHIPLFRDPLTQSYGYQRNA